MTKPTPWRSGGASGQSWKAAPTGKSWRAVIFWMLAFATIAMTPRPISQSYQGPC
jgi:hypothetical protein